MNNKIDQVKNAENEAVILLNHAMALAMNWRLFRFWTAI